MNFDSGLNKLTGYVVLEESMKFKDAQNKPDNELASLIQFWKASSSVSLSITAHNSTPVPPEIEPFFGSDPQIS
ncbi:unnamed protein product [[Candida] boidinii]|nr:unnamed protein product [[Candida] boidinii]